MGKFDKPRPNMNARKYGGPQPGHHSTQAHHRASSSYSSSKDKQRNREHSPQNKLGVDKFDFLLVVDFEATCEENRPTYPNEIIEFPCVVIDTKKLAIVHTWRSYVKPLKNPKLSDFCTRLTGITQKDVDGAKPLQEVIKDFENWFLGVIPKGSTVCFATDGPWDMRNFFYEKSIIRDGIVAGSIFHSWLDVRTTFFKWRRLAKPLKLNQMLLAMGLTFEGREHCGLDDTKNIAKLALEMLKRGCRFDYVVTVPHVDTTYAFPPWIDLEKLKKIQELAAMQEAFGGDLSSAGMGGNSGPIGKILGLDAPRGSFRRLLPLIFMMMMSTVTMVIAMNSGAEGVLQEEKAAGATGEVQDG